MKGVYTQFKIKGYNLDNLLNHVKKRKITVYDAKKININSMIVSVKHAQSKNFFAITKELCYNIEKIKDKGSFYPFLYLYKNIGLIIGSVLFLTLCIIFNDFIFRIEFTGTGNVLSRELQLQLNEYGVTQFSRFSKIDVDNLSDKLLAKNPRLTFVECSKDGNVLVIDSALAEGSSDKLTGKETVLVSDVDGIVEDLKIYRGSQKVSIGDEIKKGQVLVDGLVTVKDQEMQVNVLAVAYIKCKAVYEYVSTKENLENTLLALYEEKFDDGEIIGSNVTVTNTENQYLYLIQIEYRRIIIVG
ncbi:MAG: sporulation protein YqfD [Clostridia bacterium]|nr:sporulation protein YqfD [Clostridia bacterium]